MAPGLPGILLVFQQQTILESRISDIQHGCNDILVASGPEVGDAVFRDNDVP
jgi:hypothetical protein